MDSIPAVREFPTTLAGGGVKREDLAVHPCKATGNPKIKFCRQGADPEAGASTDLDGAL